MFSHSPLSLPSGPPDDSSLMAILVWHLPKDKMQLPTDVSFPDRCQYCIALVQSQKTVLQTQFTSVPQHLPSPQGSTVAASFLTASSISPFLSSTSSQLLILCLNFSDSTLLSFHDLRSQPESSDFGCPAVLTQLLSLQHLVLLILKSPFLDVALFTSIHRLPL